MPLRDTAVPRMAGHLPFMRGPVRSPASVLPGQIAVFGAALGSALQDSASGPLCLRETSSYFGSHFSSNMKAAMDVDQRRILDGGIVNGRIVDLGDIDFDTCVDGAASSIAAITASVRQRGALPLLLGGATKYAVSVHQGLEAGLGRRVTMVPLDLHLDWSNEDPILVTIDASSVAATWHGSSPYAQFSGLPLSEMRRRLRKLGEQNLAGIAVTGLEPARAGLSTVKTAQRLLITAVLDLIYAHLDALLPEGASHE